LITRQETHSEGPATTTQNKCELLRINSTYIYRYVDMKQHAERRNNVAKGIGLESFTLELDLESKTDREGEREREIAAGLVYSIKNKGEIAKIVG